MGVDFFDPEKPGTEVNELIPETNIDGVLNALETIVAECVAKKSRAGYFAALYLKVTKAVKQAIDAKQFHDSSQLEKLDVVFANRYLAAYHNWKYHRAPSGPWAVAFDEVGDSSAIVLQHLLLGMNAHINFDLGIATVVAGGGKPIESLRADFDAINMIIAALTNQVLSELGQVSPLLSLLGLHASNANFALLQFSIDSARDGAWSFAEELSVKKTIEREPFIAQRETTIKKLAEKLVHTTGFVNFTVWLVHLFEWKPINKIINILNQNRRHQIVMNS